jgi:HD domain
MSNERELRAAGPLIVIAGIAVVASVAATVQAKVEQPGIALAFMLFIVIGEVLRIALPNGRQAAPLASAGALAYALLPSFNGEAVAISVPLAVSVVTIGSVVGAFPRAMVGRGMNLDELSRRILTTLFAATLFRLVFAPSLTDSRSPDWRLAFAMTLAAALAAVIDAFLAAAVRASQTHQPMGTAVLDEFRALVGIASAISATGVLIALAAPKMGIWALPVFAVPLLLTQFSFRRYATIEATYQQTIQSLSKVTEVGGYTEKGHSTRVARLSVMVARELGLSERHLDDLRYAALMHDIGQLSLTTPIPGGTTTILAYHDQRRIADLGADVIEQAGLERAALIVRRQADPYRPHRGNLDDTLPIESRIIKAVNAYDDFVGDAVESVRKQQAVERLELGIDRDYDPAVVDTLARIIERQVEYAY